MTIGPIIASGKLCNCEQKSGNITMSTQLHEYAEYLQLLHRYGLQRMTEC